MYVFAADTSYAGGQTLIVVGLSDNSNDGLEDGRSIFSPSATAAVGMFIDGCSILSLL